MDLFDIILTLLLATTFTVDGYRVLVVFPVPSTSHHILGKGVVQALLAAGHEVTWVTAFPNNAYPDAPGNLTIFDMSDTLGLFKKPTSKITVSGQKDLDISVMKKFGMDVSDIALQQEKFKRLLVDEQYDAVVTEWFFSDLYAGIAAVQQTPWIILSSVVMNPYLEYLIDEVRSMPIIPMMLTNLPIPMSFTERVFNSLTVARLLLTEWWVYQETTATYEEYFLPLAKEKGVVLPSFTSALHNVSILLVNSHPSFAPAQSTPPNVIDVAGYHIDEEEQILPKDLQDILDASPQGAIFFSMGSVLKSSTLPESLRKELIDIFSNINQTVFWKFEDKLDGMPKNVYTRPIFPQTGILAHPNTKLFISHCGLLSSLETLYFGIPMLAIPVFGDQPSNARTAVSNGYALKVNYGDGMGEEIRLKLREMLNNDSYYYRAKYLSSLFQARPISPKKLISHYVELAIDTKGAPHLRAKTQLYPWYQRWLLDQLAALLAILYILYSIVVFVIKFIINTVLNHTKVKVKVKKH